MSKVPKLRFPNFYEDWEEKTILDFAPLQRGFDLPISSVKKGNYPVVFSNGILAYHNEYKVEGPGVVTGRSGTIGRFTFLEQNYWPHNTSLWVTDFKGNDPKYVYYYYVNLKVERFASRSGVPTLNRNDVHVQRCYIPKKIGEQQKIADCFSSLDELIDAERQKLDALKEHKKGLMQQLFPVDGETVPKLRFAGFRGEWEEKLLGKYLRQHPDYGMNSAAVPYSTELPTYLRITDISEDGRFLRDKMVSVEDDVTDENYLEDGDIVVARTGASVGKSYKYRESDGRLVFAGFLIRIKPDEDTLCPELLFQYLSTPQYWRWVALTSTRSGQPGINGNEYASMRLPLPPSIDEQQKIADSLSAIDELITAQADRIEQLKEHKKGLMQQLFPDINKTEK